MSITISTDRGTLNVNLLSISVYQQYVMFYMLVVTEIAISKVRNPSTLKFKRKTKSLVYLRHKSIAACVSI